jgi:hypothetical protein
MTDITKARRESVRWLILLTLNAARPVGASELIVMDCIRQAQPDVTERELRLEMDYLADRRLVDITRRDHQTWFLKLTRDGVDVVEYTVDCDPGIARPPKYWK